ncbi:hypothetical protein [Paraburkholderia sp. BL10I2N1]|uniref:hypothetical protein n=1 Tax=Paraburkholderia sp. BL10I2N1 TaxID=1938796 RepID=UPI001AADCBB8|nr:hypothetical protein [Paraburkholderia sp. BL10I2N1]
MLGPQSDSAAQPACASCSPSRTARECAARNCAGAFTDDITVRYAEAEVGSIHLLRVVGKGAKERFIPLVPSVLEALGDYIQARGFPRDPLACPVGTPLIPALPDKRDIGRVRREAAESGADVEAALAALARQAKHSTLINSTRR